MASRVTVRIFDVSTTYFILLCSSKYDNFCYCIRGNYKKNPQFILTLKWDYEYDHLLGNSFKKGVAADLSSELGAHKMFETVKVMYD